MLELVKQSKIGDIIPVYKEIDAELDALEYFAKLSNNGTKKNSILLEDNEKSIGTVNPCLMVTGTNEDFEITALNNLGKKFLNFIKKDFKFCDKAIYSKGKIYGKLASAKRAVSENERLKSKTHLDILRQIAFKFKPAAESFGGLFGMISAPSNKQEDAPNDPDYIFYFLDNMFIVDHAVKKTYFIANALITDTNKEKIYSDCSKTINNYEKLISKKAPKGKKPKKKELKLSYDTSNEEFLGIMENLKRHILDGDVIYAAPSRTAITTYNAEPLDIYAGIKNNHDSVFYINNKNGISIGSGADTVLNVKENIVELKIITSAKPRGIAKDEIEKDLDNKYEALLKVDGSEIAYNVILLDAVRNDIARVSLTGARYVDKMLVVDKQAESQNMVSSVKGSLNEDLDALHVYAAVLNPAATNGIPKIKAVEMLNKLEKGKKGFSSVLHLYHNKDIQSTSMDFIRIRKDKAYFSISSRVFHNTGSKEELETSNKKALEILNALESGGSK